MARPSGSSRGSPSGEVGLSEYVEIKNRGPTGSPVPGDMASDYTGHPLSKGHEYGGGLTGPHHQTSPHVRAEFHALIFSSYKIFN